jgi:transcriptional regulator EpsA
VQYLPQGAGSASFRLALGGAPTLQATSSDNKQEDLLGLLQTAEASLRIEQHMDLFLWLQGDVQKYLPHEVLIAAWGDFSAGEIKFDVMSPLPNFRTEALYEFGAAPRDRACLIPAVKLSAHNCGIIPFLVSLRDRWHAADTKPLVISWELERPAPLVFCRGCTSPITGVLDHMRSTLISGYADQRGSLECLFVFLSSRDLSDARYRRSERFLLPYLDNSLRRVSLLPVQRPTAPVVQQDLPESNEPAGGFGLSARESQIMEYVRIGKTNQEIGLILYISAFTVQNHLKRIFRKLDVTNRAQAVAKFQQRSTRAPRP